MYFLEDEYVKIAFDKTTGAIRHLENKKTGFQMIRQPELALGLTLLIPTKEQRNHIARSENQRVKSFEKAEDGKHITLKYGTIYGDKTGCLNIEVIVSVKLDEGELSFVTEIQNHSPYTVEEVKYPCFGGYVQQDGEEPLTAASIQFCGGMTRVRLADGFENRGYWGTDCPTFRMNYPEPAVSAPFILLEGENQGLYVGVHRYEPEYAGFIHEYKPGYGDSMHHKLLRDGEIEGVPAGFCLSVSRLPFIKPEETEKMAPVVVKFYEGDWHQGFEVYKKWRKTWFHPVKKPSWLEDADCWMTLHMNSPEGCCRYTYKELPDVMRKAKESGVQVLQLIGWAKGGQDGDEPYQDFEPKLGTQQELKEAIAEIEAMGIRVLLMCKFKWADQSTPEYKQELEEHAVRDLFGNPAYFPGYCYQTTLQFLFAGSRRAGSAMCHLSEGYRKIVMREFKKILDLKPSGILYDELANPYTLCFDESHGHKAGSCIQTGTLKLAEEFWHVASKECGEEFFLAGEGPIDVWNQYFHGSYIRSYDGNNGEPKHTPAMKYLNPEHYMATCLVGYDDREMVNQCMTYGYAINYELGNFKGVPSDAPETVKAVQEAREIRKELSDYLWNGIFSHTVGAKVKAKEGSGEFIYSVFKNRTNGRRAVVVANQHREKTLEFSVKLENSGNHFKLYKPGEGVTDQDGQQNLLKPRSFCVFVEG